MRALRVIHLSLVVAFVPRLSFLVRTLLIMTKRAATPASVLLAWAFLMAVLGTQVIYLSWLYFRCLFLSVARTLLCFVTLLSFVHSAFETKPRNVSREPFLMRFVSYFCLSCYYFGCRLLQLFGGMVCLPSMARDGQNCGNTYIASDSYTHDNLTLLNFNDVPTSLLTLFVLFVVNDW